MKMPHEGLTRLMPLVLLLAGCQQEMAKQPAYRPLEYSGFFPDQRASRPLVEGTVPWGTELRVGPYFTGQQANDTATKAALLVGSETAPGGGIAAAMPTETASYLDHIPVAKDRLGALLQRGEQRFNIYCAPCHDRLGTGHGLIVQRGFTAPPSLLTDLSRGYLHKQQKMPLTKAPVGYIYQVISEGYGAMPSYGKQVAPEDRWAIVSYVRALQFSGNATVADVPEDERQKLESAKQ